MKRVGLFILMVVFAAFIAEAQPGGQGRNFSPEDMATRQTEQIAEYVKMDKTLEKKVHDLNLKYAKKSQELRGGGNFMDMSDAQREKMRAQMNAQQEEKDAELKKIFSADQYKQYEKYRAEARQRMQQRRP
jgi:regulator of protease activity HflC (stomatin/prohibitin superfamily)